MFPFGQIHAFAWKPDCGGQGSDHYAPGLWSVEGVAVRDLHGHGSVYIPRYSTILKMNCVAAHSYRLLVHSCPLCSLFRRSAVLSECCYPIPISISWMPLLYMPRHLRQEVPLTEGALFALCRAIVWCDGGLSRSR